MNEDNPDTSTYIHWLEEKNGQTELTELLDETEQQQAASYKFDQHRQLYIAAHVFLRKVLSYHAPLPPESWRFYKNDFGKPYIENHGFQSIQFNLSHTQGMIVCAVNKTYEVGTDVEKSRPLKYMEAMSRRNYTDREYTDIYSNDCEKIRSQRFYTYWTLKESLVKAIGCGLSMPLKNIGFKQLKNSSWTLEKNIEFKEKMSIPYYIFANKEIIKDYQISTAVNAEINKTNNPDFCYIDSNPKDTFNWK